MFAILFVSFCVAFARLGKSKCEEESENVSKQKMSNVNPSVAKFNKENL